MATKVYTDKSVLSASMERVSKAFDDFDKLYISFSGGKDSTVMMHLVMQEAMRRNRKVGVLIIDLEAQYSLTVTHMRKMVEMYRSHIDLHWFCGELLLRNAVSDFEPKWVCWDAAKKDIWVREMPDEASNLSQYDFYIPKMEFEEVMVLFGKWYAQGSKLCGGFIGIRSDESLHRYRAIVSNKKGLMHDGLKWTTKISNGLFNLYPIYDWRTSDIWLYHARNADLPYNQIYDMMTRAGVKFGNQRLYAMTSAFKLEYIFEIVIGFGKRG